MEQKEKAARSNVEMRRKYPHEDRALKAAGQMLGEALVSLTDLGVKVRRMIPTEQVVLQIVSIVFRKFNFCRSAAVS